MGDKYTQNKKRSYMQMQDVKGTFSDKKSFYDYLKEQLYVGSNFCSFYQCDSHFSILTTLPKTSKLFFPRK